MVRLDRPNQRTYHESEVRERLRSDPRASMREEARAAAAEELGSSSSQITDFLIFVMLFVGGYHGFLLFTKKRGTQTPVSHRGAVCVSLWTWNPAEVPSAV
jgi:hypothetical protein